MFELVPFRTHSIGSFNPFHELEEMEKQFFSRSPMSHFAIDVRDTGESYIVNFSAIE